MASSTGKIRVEKDTFGPIEVPGEHYWGAQTERSRGNFKIGTSGRPLDIDRVEVRVWSETGTEVTVLRPVGQLR